MICEKCKTKKATIFYTDEHNSSHSLCSQCSSKLQKPIQNYNSGEFITLSLQNLRFNNPSLCNDLPLTNFCSGATKQSKEIQCMSCMTTLYDFNKTSSVGCPLCYDTFKEDTLLKPIYYKAPQEYNQAIRIPKQQKQKLQQKKQIAELKIKMSTAIKSEDFESAAILRDKIKNIEKSI